ncbi:beta-channel forming cytolysin [Bacillus cereus VD196]|uniref:Beta-channel forming cytolysin n=1 Tax=Bacillus cereus VD196 TaxID=1053243 RepID=A0A9W5PXN9_BACCE|nr:beta-channel forming cytolysin [Bacillus cereus]EOO57811.1 beta-channel forming cytolysin [Bacillus cereus VD196]
MRIITRLFLGTTLSFSMLLSGGDVTFAQEQKNVVDIGRDTKVHTNFSAMLSGGNVTFAQEQKNVVDIGRDTKVYTSFSTIYNEGAKVKTSIQVSFIEDPNSDKRIAIINTAGSNIAADKKIIDKSFSIGKPGETIAGLEWPSSYHIEMELKDEQAQFYKVVPANTVDTKSVMSTVGYAIGGGIKMSEKPDANISGAVNWLTSVKYDQSDYKTFLTYDSDKKVNWNISFVSAMNQGYGPYDRDSNNLTYGNQLFMKSRNGSVWAKNNFIANEEMPGLASYGFSPGVIAVVITDKDVTKPSKLNIRYGRTKDLYSLKWGDIAWVGGLEKNINSTWGGTYYEIDWSNHQIIEKLDLVSLEN